MKKRELLEQILGVEVDAIIIGRRLFNVIKTSEEREQVSKEMYDLLFNMFDFVDEIMQNKDDFAVFNGEFEVVLGIQLPLYVILDLAKMMCDDVSFVLSNEDNQRLEGIIEKARSLEFSAAFKKVWHINPRLKKVVGRKTNCSFSQHTGLNSVINANGERTYYKSTIDNFNHFLLNQSVFLPSDELLARSEEMTLNYDFSSYPDLVCDDLFVADVYNMEYDYEDEIHSNRQQILLFEEQHAELEQKYKRLRKQVNEVRRARFRKLILPFYKNENFAEFALVSTIDWNLDDNNKMLAGQLESLFYKIRDLMKKGYDLDTILTRNSLFQGLSSTIRLIEYNAEYCKQKIITDLIVAYARASSVKKKIFSTRNLTYESLEQRLKKLSIFKLAECASKMKSNALGYYHLSRIIHEGE